MSTCTKNSKYCAICKYWYDPCNTAITPRVGGKHWDFDPKAKHECTKKGNRLTAGIYSCPMFECKLP